MLLVVIEAYYSKIRNEAVDVKPRDRIIRMVLVGSLNLKQSQNAFHQRTLNKRQKERGRSARQRDSRVGEIPWKRGRRTHKRGEGPLHTKIPSLKNHLIEAFRIRGGRFHL